MLCCV